LDDLKNVGESSYSPGDGTDQRVQSLVFMMMMMMIFNLFMNLAHYLRDITSENHDTFLCYRLLNFFAESPVSVVK